MDKKTDFSKRQSQYWDGYTKEMDTLDLVNITRAEKIELKFLLNILGDLKNKRVLDLGCGTGKFGLKLARYAKEVVGIDISKHSIDIANKTAKKNGIKNFKGVCNDFKDVNYENYFDYILAVNLIHHADEIDTIFSNVKRSLKKNGVFVIFEINSLNPLYLPFLTIIGQLRSHLTLEFLRSNIWMLKGLLKRNSFRVTKVYKWAILPTMLYNYSLRFKRINEFLNTVPIVKVFSAFHVILAKKG